MPKWSLCDDTYRTKDIIRACRIDDHGKTIYLDEFIMELMLGRPLAHNERVRPKNGDYLDCRRPNLELVVMDETEGAA